jgi:AcrR family transcriptional regulator
MRVVEAAMLSQSEDNYHPLTTNTELADTPKRGRGRPRRAGADEEILTVTRELLRERGYRDFTVDAISDRTGIAKTTIYRRFPSKGELVAAAIAPMNGVAQAQDIATILRETANVLRLLTDPEGEAINVVRAVVQPRRARIRELLARDSSRDADLAADLLTGALLARLLDGRELGDIDELIGAVL